VIANEKKSIPAIEFSMFTVDPRYLAGNRQLAGVEPANVENALER